MKPSAITTRQQAEQAGIALPKKQGDYRCVWACGYRGTHDQMHKHQLHDCHFRPGSTIKTQKG